MKYPGVQKIIDILRSIDNSPESTMGFDMGHTLQNSRYSRHPCGTACCIGGWAQLALAETGIMRGYVSDSLSVLCDVPQEDAEGICYGQGSVSLRDITLPMAIDMLEHYRDTGVVDWERAARKHGWLGKAR